MRISSLPPWFVAALLLAVPLALALVLPAPSSDTRELLSWGLHPSLSTPKQPPLMQWMGFLVMRFAWPTTFWCVALTQVLNAAGLTYVYATLRLWSAREEAALSTALLAGAVYFIGAPVAFALNADILQFPFWAAILFHGMRAFETGQAKHWIGLTIAFSFAFYAKYTVMLLVIAMVGASLIVPTFRRIWRDVRLYLSAAAGALLIAPHLLAAAHSGTVEHATGTLFSSGGLVWRLKNVGELFSGFVAYLAPAWILYAVGAARGDVRVALSQNVVAQFVRSTGAIALALLLVLVVGLGFKYPSRYDSPFLFIAWLCAASCLHFDLTRWSTTQRWMKLAALGFGALLATGGALVYGIFTSHPRQQEPLVEAAAALHAEWRSRYACGPAYVMGDFWSAYGLGVSMQPPRPGVHLIEMEGVPGYDPILREREGAIVIYRDKIDEAQVRPVFPELDLANPERLKLPFAGTLDRGAAIAYEYVFVPPKGC
jgi:4-amino-4-deoxy-L-arabinose transferase-like glycosyltransferase